MTPGGPADPWQSRPEDEAGHRAGSRYGAFFVGLFTGLVLTMISGPGLNWLENLKYAIPADADRAAFQVWLADPADPTDWLYADDRRFHYARLDAGYAVMPVRNRCQGFNPIDVRTWCDAERKAR